MKELSEHRISILIPTYNSESTLQVALESIRRQTFSSIDVVVIDGGSSDGTLSLVDGNRDLVTDVISEPDQGIYDAINKGVGRARGRLIGVLGSDDELLPGALESVWSAWLHSPSDIVAGQAWMSASDGTSELRVDEDYGVGALLSGIPFCHNAMFATPEAYKKVGSYDLTYSICGDANWVHRAIRAGCTCIRVDLPVVRFSLTGTSSSQSERTMAETYRIVTENFPGLRLDDAERLFRAVRGWSDGNDVEEILRRYEDIPDLQVSAAIAFLARARRLAQRTWLPVEHSDVASSNTHKASAMVRRMLRNLKLATLVRK